MANPSRGWSVSASSRKQDAHPHQELVRRVGHRLQDWLAAANDLAALSASAAPAPRRALQRGDQCPRGPARPVRSALGWAFLRESRTGEQPGGRVARQPHRFVSVSIGDAEDLRIGGSLRYRGDRILGYWDKTVSAADLSRDSILGTGTFPASASLTCRHRGRRDGATLVPTPSSATRRRSSKRIRWNVIAQRP